MSDKLFLILLGIFLLLYGIAAVSNVRIEWMTPITGFSALCAGVVALFRALK